MSPTEKTEPRTAPGADRTPSADDGVPDASGTARTALQPSASATVGPQAAGAGADRNPQPAVPPAQQTPRPQGQLGQQGQYVQPGQGGRPGAPGGGAPARPASAPAAPEAVRPSASTASSQAPRPAPARPAASAATAAAVGSAVGSAAARPARPGEQPRPASSASEPGQHAQPAPAAAEAAPRRVRLSLSRVDLWSVARLTFLLSVALGIIAVVAVALLWTVLDAMGVFTQLDSVVRDVVGTESNFRIVDIFSLSRVLSVTVFLAVVDVVLITLVTTIGALLYNLAGGLVGGVRLTLSDD